MSEITRYYCSDCLYRYFRNQNNLREHCPKLFKWSTTNLTKLPCLSGTNFLKPGKARLNGDKESVFKFKIS